MTNAEYKEYAKTAVFQCYSCAFKYYNGLSETLLVEILNPKADSDIKLSSAILHYNVSDRGGKKPDKKILLKVIMPWSIFGTRQQPTYRDFEMTVTDADKVLLHFFEAYKPIEFLKSLSLVEYNKFSMMWNKKPPIKI